MSAAATAAILTTDHTESARQLREVVTVIRGSAEPVSCYDIEILCHMTANQASRNLKRLLQGGIIEKELRTRVTSAGPHKNPTGRFMFSQDYKAGRVEFNPVLLAKGLQTIHPVLPPYYFGPNQLAVLNALESGPLGDKELHERALPHLNTRGYRKTVISLAVRGCIRFDGLRWCRT